MNIEDSSFLFVIDTNESSLNPISLHFHYSHLQQETWICNYPVLQVTLGRPCWIRACCKDWSWRTLTDRSQIYQPVVTLFGTGIIRIKISPFMAFLVRNVECFVNLDSIIQLVLGYFLKS